MKTLQSAEDYLEAILKLREDQGMVRSMLRRLTPKVKGYAVMVISAISLVMAAPPLMAMPTSAMDSAGESLMPSPIIMTVERPQDRAAP